MNETMYSFLKNLPLVGPAVKAAYIGSKVKVLIQKVEGDPQATAELKGKAGNELEEALNEEANELYDSEISPIVQAEGIPEEVEQPVKEKAIEELVAALRKKLERNKSAGAEEGKN
ncbi:hypothetical protein [Thermonema rossianum]|jgi:hypothetical protein|uniref:hypothetical protein n=1 Tax=Thermonema rossianum TaxID=55505 RepID=UPI0012FA1790|nr:hypothetical protein [Thermonema rossianum]